MRPRRRIRLKVSLTKNPATPMTQRRDSPTDLSVDKRDLTASIILACGEHVPLIEDTLDRSDVLTWTVVPAVQSRRLGFLQNVPRRNSRSCSVILAFGNLGSIQRAVDLLCQARERQELCQECAIFRWPIERMAAAALALDPVCDEAVDPSRSFSHCHRGQVFYFCSESCLEAFLTEPDKYFERQHSPYRVDRRDLLHQVVDRPTRIEGEMSHEDHQENFVSG